MAQRSVHYEAAFERYLRSRKIPYIAVDEAKKTLFPQGVFGQGVGGVGRGTGRRGTGGGTSQTGLDPIGSGNGENGERAGVVGEGTRDALKSFDFVIYGEGTNLLIEIKGRRAGASMSARLENWVTHEDVQSLLRWERLFGTGFEACFIFVYWFESQPADTLFEELLESEGMWYGLRAVPVRDYARVMRTRSQRWGTCDIPRADFDALSVPFAPAACGSEFPAHHARSRSCSHGDRLPIFPILPSWHA